MHSNKPWYYGSRYFGFIEEDRGTIARSALQLPATSAYLTMTFPDKILTQVRVG